MSAIMALEGLGRPDGYRAGMQPVRFLDIRWSTRDPDALVARLRGAGFAVESGRVLAFPSATIGIDAGTSPTDRLEIAEGSASPGSSTGPHPNRVEDVLAVGWATVDRERFVAGLGIGAVAQLPDDPHLGAFVVRHGLTRPLALVIEPATEGRLAATLARSGEGPTAIYLGLGAGGMQRFAAAAHPGGNPVSAVRPGPLGPSGILLGGAVWDPAVVLVAR
jgi:hypothetical protein